MKARLFLVFFGCCIAILSAEIAARLWTFYIEGRGKSISELLKESDSQGSTLNQTNTNNLRGLIKLSNNPKIVYELRPNTSGQFQNQPYQSNSFGARDTEYSQTKPSDTIRIVGIGDSVMFGWGAKVEDNYLSVIEREDQKLVSPLNLEVINFAVPGFNTAMEVELFSEKVLPFDPDVVVLHTVNNDLDVPLFMSKPHNIFSLRESFLLKLVVPRNSVSALVRYGVDNSSDILEEYRSLAGIGSFTAALNRLATLCHEHKIPVIVVYGRLPPEMRKVLTKMEKQQGFLLAPVKNFIEQLVQDKNIPNNPKARAAALQVSSDDSHPNALGHQAYARALHEALVKTFTADFLKAKEHVPAATQQ